ncbi:allophanate hydrolase [Blastococcus sp. TF02A-35]|uniref:allophanate hydrolase n=1 Tax=Blastococcus sp. TF02A-35 TaxID=2559612 RepID=UPI0010733DAA|nr:allophanate hydrolase [Blastococcus sp. TF02A_35]TFV51725.1 allophanate hydrolase [Blastococcus sp. TF02A_35]
MSAVERVRAAYLAVAEVDRPEVWVHLRDEADVLAEAAAVDRRVAAGERLPLAGLAAAVKNNVDVAGLPTTAGCPAFATAPAAADAPAVARLRAAGAVVLGTTNLDQFATGLVGTRSPHGAVRDARRPDRISGGSSSGSAVAVALGLVDLAVGTDTAGSGRVPAALQGVVGIKPTVGVVPVEGVVPACRSYDCVTVFARDLGTAEAAMAEMAGGARPWPPAAPLAARPGARVAVPAELPGLSASRRAAFAVAVERLAAQGVAVQPVDLTPFLDAARLLYDGGLVAERHAAVGAFVDAHRDDVDPVVGAIIGAAGTVTATRLLHDRERLEQLTATALATLDGLDALLVPTTTSHPTLAEVAADPVGVNSGLGTYTNFCNLMDLCAVAVPSGTVRDDDGEDLEFGVSVLARAGADALALDLARLVELPTPSVARAGARAVAVPRDLPWPVAAGADATRLLVVGAHLRGQPLAGELDALGARWLGPATTAAAYRLARLGTVPAKPGLARVGTAAGVAIGGQLWLVPTAQLGTFLAALPAPMHLGRVELADRSEVVGFGCSLEAWQSGRDISEHGDWLTAQRAAPPAGVPHLV